jgi:PIN domain nuclease of toxin-antitoxin system
LRFLLDTHLLIWSLIEPGKLSHSARETLNDPANSFVFSAVSIWEIGVKFALGRPDFSIDPTVARQTLLRHGLHEMAFTGAHAELAASLPNIHRDPSDRMLIAQAKVEGLTLLTADAKVAQYPGPIRKV